MPYTRKLEKVESEAKSKGIRPVLFQILASLSNAVRVSFFGEDVGRNYPERLLFGVYNPPYEAEGPLEATDHRDPLHVFKATMLSKTTMTIQRLNKIRRCYKTVFENLMLRTNLAIVANFIVTRKLACSCLLVAVVAGCQQDNDNRVSDQKIVSEASGRPANDSSDGVAISDHVEANAEPIRSNENRDEDVSSLDIPALQERGAAALDEGDDDEAYQLARKAIRLAPNDPSSIFLMARVLGARHRFPEATQMLDQLAVTTPDARLPILGQTAQWMVQFGQWKEAEQRFRAILTDAPQATLVHRMLAELLIRQGRNDEATEHLRTLCQQGDIEEIELRHLLAGGRAFHGDANLESLSPIGLRGKALYNISQGRWSIAKKDLQQIQLLPPEAVSVLGRIYVHLDDQQSLREWAGSTTGVENPDAGMFFVNAAILAGQGDHVSAVRQACRAVFEDPTDGDAYQLLSRSLSELGMSEESKEALRRYQLIAETKRIGREMSLTKERDDAMLVSLIRILDELQRPWEALNWSGVRLAYAKANSTLESEEIGRLADLVRQRRSKLKGKEWIQDPSFIQCGIDVDSIQPKSEEQQSE